VFIHRIQRTEDYIVTLEQITQAAEAGKAQIITSAVTLAEVIKDADGNTLSDSDEERITALFDNGFTIIRPLDGFIGRKARELARYYGLKPVDAIHAATAMVTECPVIHTYDDRHLGKKDNQIGNPRIRIKHPVWGGDIRLPLPAQIEKEAKNTDDSS
jgi:predicted nucleic acid-binding protein